MAANLPPLPDSMIRKLTDAGSLRRLGACEKEQAAERNNTWEARLMRQPRDYLRDYDLLFRQLTRYLQAQGLDVGERHPHQMLATVLQHASPESPEHIRDMIRQRHELKYGRQATPDVTASAVLMRLQELMRAAAT